MEVVERDVMNRRFQSERRRELGAGAGGMLLISADSNLMIFPAVLITCCKGICSQLV